MYTMENINSRLFDIRKHIFSGSELLKLTKTRPLNTFMFYKRQKRTLSDGLKSIVWKKFHPENQLCEIVVIKYRKIYVHFMFRT